jgi:hypothetical protein
MKIFEPEILQPSPSPSRSARVARLPGSERAPGSGERVAAERLARGEPRQPLALLLLAAPAGDRLAHETDVHRDDSSHRRVGPAQLLGDEAVRDRVEPHAAVLLRKRRAQVADLRQAADDAAIHLFLAVPVASVRHDLALDELPRSRPDQLLLGAQR